MNPGEGSEMLSEVERWCISQEYVGISDKVERGIKLLYDYRKSHSDEEYEELVRELAGRRESVRRLDFICDRICGDVKVFHEGELVGRISEGSGDCRFVSYAGIGGNRYPVTGSGEFTFKVDPEDVRRAYRDFDKSIMSGDYLLRGDHGYINGLYLRFVRDHYGR